MEEDDEPESLDEEVPESVELDELESVPNDEDDDDALASLWLV